MTTAEQSPSCPMRIISAEVIGNLLLHAELTIVREIAEAYLTHHRGNSSLPHSVFLRFPEHERNRIIGLPAYLGGHTQAAGIKWIASFPDNLAKSLDRASALVILNDVATGYPKAVLESSIISAKRTAASAALATMHLKKGNFSTLGLVGCGVIGHEIVRFLVATNPALSKLIVHDNDRTRMEHFADRCSEFAKSIDVEIVDTLADVFRQAPVVALATTAASPHIWDRKIFTQPELILNVSLRDIAAELILESTNIVDDIEHICREKTSVHLAEQLAGHRNFICAELAEIIDGQKSIPESAGRPIVFSPFGLGVLDLALAELVYGAAIRDGLGVDVVNFFPVPWRLQCVSQPTGTRPKVSSRTTHLEIES